MLNGLWLSLIILAMCAASALGGYWLALHGKYGDCWHHDQRTGLSWITGELIDLGRRKMFTCSNCRRVWFT